MLSIWEKIKWKLNGGILWTSPRCKEQFYVKAFRWHRIEKKIRRHLRRIHGYPWKFLRPLGENIYAFMEKDGLIEKELKP